MNKWDEREDKEDKRIEELEGIVKELKDVLSTIMKATKDLNLEYQIIVNKYNAVMALLEAQDVSNHTQESLNQIQINITEELMERVQALENDRDNKA